MRGVFHFALSGAVAFAVADAVTRDPPTAGGLALCVGLASLLPDLDSPGTAAGLLRVRRAVRAANRAGLQHRSGWTHSLAACALWPALIAWVLLAAGATATWSLQVGAVLAVGGLLHLAGDWLPLGSRSGVPLLWPLTRRRYKLQLRP
jgi:membrane-bound metal-dependent hydrolase YbcI (DUF457 family)